MSEAKRRAETVRSLTASNEDLRMRLTAAKNTIMRLVDERPAVEKRRLAGLALGRDLQLEDLWKAFVCGALEAMRMPVRPGYSFETEKTRILFDRAADGYVKLLIERENPKPPAAALAEIEKEGTP